MPSHRPRSLVWTALLACVLTLLLCSVSAARTTSRVSVASAGSPSISSGRTTVFYDHHGKYLCAVFRRAGWWEVKHGYDEIWIETNGRRLEAHFTHHLDGWAQRRSPSQWNMWNVFASANERPPYKFYGRIVWRARNRWIFSDASGHVLGYTLGPDGPAAGTAALIFWWLDGPQDC